MKTKLNWTRVKQLCLLYFNLNLKRMIFSGLAFVLILTAVSIYLIEKNMFPVIIDLFTAAFIIYGFIFATSSFLDFENEKKETGFFMLPASLLEKLVSRIILIIPVFLVYCISLLILSNILLLIYSSLTLNDFGFVPLYLESFFYLYLFFVPVASFIIFGLVYFKKLSVIKTAVTLVLTLNLYYLFTRIVYKFRYPELNDPESLMVLSPPSVDAVNNFLSYYLPWIYIVLFVSVSSFFLFLTYKCLQRREVINGVS